jgi:hypothetical protein
MKRNLMITVCTSATALLFTLTGTAQPRDSSGTPTAETIGFLSRESRGQRMFLTTTSGRSLVRIGRVNPEGLAEISGAKTVPSTVTWDQVTRLERRTSHKTFGRWLGAGAGGVLLSGTGLGVGAIAASALTGYWLGGRVGDWWPTGSEVLYTGGRPESRARARGPVAQAEPEGIERVRDHAGDLLRVRGEFGEFVGHVGSITSEGLSELAPRRGMPSPPATIGWSEVNGISRRGGNAGVGALTGVLVVAIPGTVVGAAVGSMSNEAGSGAAAGAAAGTVAGALVGAVVGSLIPSWHPIYKAPVPR